MPLQEVKAIRQLFKHNQMILMCIASRKQKLPMTAPLIKSVQAEQRLLLIKNTAEMFVNEQVKLYLMNPRH